MDGTPGLFLLLYYGACHSIGLVALVVAFVASRLLSGKGDRRFALVATSLALIVLPFSILSYSWPRGGLPLLARNALWLVSSLGESLMISSLPRFIHCFFASRREKAIFRAWDLAALLSFASFPASLVLERLALDGRHYQGWIAILYVPMVLMPASIVYVIAAYLRRARSIEAPWRRMLREITVSTIAFLPLLVAFDFFPGLTRGLGLPLYLKAFPLMYALLGLIYLRLTVPRLALARFETATEAGASALATTTTESPAAGGSLAAYGLSEREAEVAGLLLEGLSYREIGDRLFISLSTVKTHVERIYRKTGARNKMELARM
jgi:DNA-binding CsgD family transcriptional regulator